MGLLDKFKGLTIPYDDDDDEFIEEERDYAPQPARGADIRQTQQPPAASRNPFYDYDEPAPATPARDNKVVNIHTTTQLQVVLVKPERFETAAEIADHLREKRTVVMNLEQTNKEVSRRLIDFLSGVAYAQDGKIKKVAVSTYIITPYNVDIMGDLIDELENNGMYF